VILSLGAVGANAPRMRAKPHSGHDGPAQGNERDRSISGCLPANEPANRARGQTISVPRRARSSAAIFFFFDLPQSDLRGVVELGD
jgi:hypothetical protein